MDPNAPGLLVFTPLSFHTESELALWLTVTKTCGRSDVVPVPAICLKKSWQFLFLSCWEPLRHQVRSCYSERKTTWGHHVERPCGQGEALRLHGKEKPSHPGVQMNPAFRPFLSKYQTCEWIYFKCSRPSHHLTATTWETARKTNRITTQLKLVNF